MVILLYFPENAAKARADTEMELFSRACLRPFEAGKSMVSVISAIAGGLLGILCAIVEVNWGSKVGSKEYPKDSKNNLLIFFLNY